MASRLSSVVRNISSAQAASQAKALSTALNNANTSRTSSVSSASSTTRTQTTNAKPAANRSQRANYILSHRFYIEMDGVIRAAFNECSGFGLDVKKEQYLEGGVNDQQRVLLGHAEFQDTTLKRGMTNDPSFWLWMKEIMTGQSTGTSLVRNRQNINILMMNQAGAIMQVCTLIGATPIGWKAPAFQADSSSVAIEEMTLAYEGINMQFQVDEPLGAGGASSQLQRDTLGFFPEQ
ncbi:MAG: phage tail protein [Leptolyngbya sp. SIO1D8]|nr:phage tail protein [Leptolyngbya sp. SIO1D8]